MNRYNKIAASFVLKTSDLPLTSTTGANNVGTMNNTYRSSMTWQNVDIQSILGEMWNKYTYFQILLVSCITSPLTFIHSPDTIVTANLQGLQFINSSYSTKTKSNSLYTQIGIVTFFANLGSSSQNNDTSFVTFKKGSGLVNLTITLNNTVSEKLATAFLFTNTEGAAIFPHQNYAFRIEGVE